MERIFESDKNLKSDKAPGVTGVPPNAFKCLNGANLRQVFHYINNFWENKNDYDEWHTCLGVLVPKKGDLSNPNTWQGINLMDVCSKIINCILNDLLY